MSNRTIVIRVPRIATEEVLSGTDQGSFYAYYQVPEGVLVATGGVASPLLGNYPRYRGNLSSLSTDCDITPPVDAADPFWNDSLTMIGYVDNKPYEQALPYWALTPAAGQTIVDIVEDALQPFLTVQPGGADHKWLRGSVPAGYASVSFSLKGIQSDGRFALHTFTIYPLSSTVYLMSNYAAGTKKLTLYVGADSAGAPTIKLLYAPTGYDKGGTYNMDRLVSPFNSGGLAYPFSFPYNNIITGQYIGQINWLNQTRYFSLDIVDRFNIINAVVDTPANISLPRPGPPTFDGTKEPVDATPGTNPAPILVNPQPDFPITTFGAITIAPPQDEFYDNPGDTRRLFGYFLDGGQEKPLLQGITFDPATGIFVIAADFANKDFVLRRKYVDSADQFAVDDFLVTVRRGSPVINRIINNIAVVEGRQGTVQLYDVHEDGSWSEVTQADGTFEITDAQYPDGMTLSSSNTGRAIVSTRIDTVNQDVPVNVRFRPTTGNNITGVVTVLNQASTITTRIINNISVNEGSQGTLQLYDVLSDGSWVAVTQASGVFEFAQVQYPDGMTLTYTGNGRATVSTIIDSVSDNVAVKVRFRPTTGNVIEGVVTVINQASSVSPIVGQLINNISIVEGAQGVLQVYDVHADGNWTEVTQANGSKFEFIGNYPNGMSLSYGNTARALVQTRTDSVTANVDVNVRFTYASGQVVNGIVTVLNQTTTTPPSGTPTVVAVDWAWTRVSASNVDAANRVYVWIKVENSQGLTVAYYQPASGNPKTNYSSASVASGDVNGYNFRDDINPVPGYPFTFYFKPTGGTEVAVTINIPTGASTSRTKIYP